VEQQQLNPEVPLAVLFCSGLLLACSHALTLVPALPLLLAMCPLCVINEIAVRIMKRRSCYEYVS
jgi:hypothetical protein